MRYTISNQHINYYIEHGYIEFEEIFPQGHIESFVEKISPLVDLSTDKSLYETGRDIWRKNPMAKKIATDNTLVHIAKTLTKSRYLRLAFDQMYKSTYFIPAEKNLESTFSFQNLTSLCFLRLDKSAKKDDLSPPYIPTAFGQVTFVNPQKAFSYAPTLASDTLLYCIGYGGQRTLYVHNLSDFHNYYLKQYGYSFNDHLRDPHHPVVS